MMDMTIADVSARNYAFQLPVLHPEIPTKPILSNASGTIGSLAKNLITSNVIDVDKLPNRVKTTDEILMYGMQNWLSSRVNKYKRLHFTFGIMGSEQVIEMINHYQDMERKYDFAPVLYVEAHGIDDGRTIPIYEVEPVSRRLSAKYQWLITSAVDMFVQASRQTLWIRNPMDLAQHFGWNMWEEEFDSRKCTDDLCLEPLLERIDDEDEAQHYLPSVILPLFGAGVCFPIAGAKLPKLKAVKAVAALNENALASKIAHAIIELDGAIKKAKKAKAVFPDHDGCGIDGIIAASTIIFKADERVYQEIDNDVNSAMECGGTTVLGWAELPHSADEIQTYFNHLELNLAVINKLDDLLAIISVPTWK